MRSEVENGRKSVCSTNLVVTPIKSRSQSARSARGLKMTRIA